MKCGGIAAVLIGILVAVSPNQADGPENSSGSFLRAGADGDVLVLTIGADSRYRASMSSGNPAASHEIGTGKLTGSGDKLRFDVPIQIESRNWGEHLVAVRWGRWRYILEESELVKFCAAVRKKDEPRTTRRGDFFLDSRGDQFGTPDGEPQLPDEFPRNLLKSKLSASIVKSLSESEGLIDKGILDGVRLGTILKGRRNIGKSYIDHEVIKVEKNRSVVRAKLSDASDRVRIGLELTDEYWLR